MTNGQLMIASLGTLPANGTAMLSFSLTPSGNVTGWVTNSSEVNTSILPDPFDWNNHAVLKLRLLPQDNDRDGLPDEWETSHGLDPNNSGDALADNDGDGHNNMQEFLAGTLPQDASSVFRVLHVEIQGDSIAIEFSTVVGKRYAVQAAPAVSTSSWMDIYDDVQGTGAPVTLSVPVMTDGSIRFLRVQVKTP